MKMPLAYSSVPMAPSHNTAPFCSRVRNPVDMVFSETGGTKGLLELYRKLRESAICARVSGRCEPRTRSVIKLQQLMANDSVLSGARLVRLAALLSALTLLLLFAACGSGQPSTTTTSGVKNRAFITNTFSGNLQIVDTQNDTTSYTQQTTNSSGQIVPGSPVVINIASTATLIAESASHATTAVYDPSTFALYFITNSTETVTGNAAPLNAIS